MVERPDPWNSFNSLGGVAERSKAQFLFYIVSEKNIFIKKAKLRIIKLRFNIFRIFSVFIYKLIFLK